MTETMVRAPLLRTVGGVLDLVYMAVTGVNGTLVANSVARFAVTAVFLAMVRVARPHQT